jgi:diguanylate cyclase (GGDEF)-like protein/PAS domain S-box-containing protein
VIKQKENNKYNINLLNNPQMQGALSRLESITTKSSLNELLNILNEQNDYINNLFKSMRKLGLFINDVENNKVFPNDLWYQLGYTEEDMLDIGFMAYIHPDDLQRVKDQSIIPSSMDKEVNKIKFRIKDKKGSWHWIISTTIFITTNEKGYVRQYIGFDTDFTEEVEIKELLEKTLFKAEKLRMKAETSAIEANTLREVSSIITSALDLNKTMKAILDQAKKVIPYNTASIQILKDNYLSIIGGAGWNKPDEIIGNSFQIPGDNPNTEVIKTKEPLIISNISKKNFAYKKFETEEKTESWIGIPILMRNSVIGMMAFNKKEKNYFTSNHAELGKAFASQVAIALENARIYEEVKELSTIDPLTETKNRRSFFENALQQEKLYRRYGTVFSLIMLDIDFFKKVNDQFGHQYGDKILIDLVSVIKKGLRESDILCRYGGEEFAILLPQSDEADAYEIAERIRLSVKANLTLKDTKLQITVSMGCADLKTSEIKTIDNLISKADKALYHAKNTGRDRSQCFSNLGGTI